MQINKSYFGNIITQDIINNIYYIIDNYNQFSKEDLDFIRYYIIEHEDILRYKYPIVPYDLTEDKIMILSDTHLGHKDDNMQYIFWAYEAAQDENIHKVLIAGDLFEGIIKSTINDIKIDEIKKNYNSNYYLYLLSLARSFPNINNIETKILLGNHDLSMIYEKLITHKDLINIYNQIPNSELIGIGKAYINWTSLDNKKNCRFILNYDTNIIFNKHNYNKELITISGHHHDYKEFDNEIYLPSLSNNRAKFPGLVTMELKNNNLIINPIQILPGSNIKINNKQKTLYL